MNNCTKVRITNLIENTVIYEGDKIDTFIAYVSYQSLGAYLIEDIA